MSAQPRPTYATGEFRAALGDISSMSLLTSISVAEALQAFLVCIVDRLEGWAKDRNAKQIGDPGRSSTS